MVMLVTLQQASDHLRRDSADDDALLTIMIKAASSAVINYLKVVDFLDSAGDVYTDSAGDPDVPAPIMQATLIIVGMLYADRDAPDFRAGNAGTRLGDNPLPRTVLFLLDPYRKPTVA